MFANATQVVMLGFVILSHSNPAQLLRLVKTLNTAYGAPPIACHHDFGQSELDRSAFPSNVHFVEPYIKTAWAKWSVVRAGLEALRLLYQRANPTWFTLLGETDYPVRPANEVIGDLSARQADAYLDYRPVRRATTVAPDQIPANPALSHLASQGARACQWRFYLGAQIGIPIIRAREPDFRNTKTGWRLGRYTVHLPFAAPQAPFHKEFRCFAGDHWFSGNRRVANILLNPTADHLRLRTYLRFRTIPEECYYATVLGNDRSLRIDKNTKRFAEWQGGGAHPQWVKENDLPKMLASGSHFARKFMPNASVLDELDRIVGGPAATNSAPRTA